MDDSFSLLVRSRHSVRSYAGKPLSDAERDELLGAVAGAGCPFASAEALSIDLADFDITGPCKPGTYGMINGAASFLLMGFDDTPEASLAAGFVFEQVILRATSLGLGTCWMAATFRNTDFEAKAGFGPGRKIKVVSPVGVPAARRSFLERVTRFAAGSDRRKPFSSLFFSGDFRTPLVRENTFGNALEMLRLAPSSMNSQPWRAVVEGGRTVHFYYESKAKMPYLDCGIGLCHFALADACGNEAGMFYIAADAPEAPSGLTYLRSYSRV